MDNYGTHKTQAVRAWLSSPSSLPRSLHAHLSVLAQSGRAFLEPDQRAVGSSAAPTPALLSWSNRYGNTLIVTTRIPKPFVWHKSADTILASVARAFQIVQLIRGPAPVHGRLPGRAAGGVAARTTDRDVADLQHQGVPIEGEAGVGYRLGGVQLAPDVQPGRSQCAGGEAARLAQAWLDPGLARGGRRPGQDRRAAPVARLAAEAQALYAPLVGLMPTRPRCRPCARRCKAAMWCRSTTPTCKAAPACAGCGRWAALTRARCGPCQPGASCATTFGAFASTASRPSRYCPGASGKSLANAWPPCLNLPAPPQYPPPAFSARPAVRSGGSPGRLCRPGTW